MQFLKFRSLRSCIFMNFLCRSLLLFVDAIDEQIGTPEGVPTCNLATPAHVFARSTISVEKRIQSDLNAIFFCDLAPIRGTLATTLRTLARPWHHLAPSKRSHCDSGRFPWKMDLPSRPSAERAQPLWAPGKTAFWILDDGITM